MGLNLEGGKTVEKKKKPQNFWSTVLSSVPSLAQKLGLCYEGLKHGLWMLWKTTSLMEVN